MRHSDHELIAEFQRIHRITKPWFALKNINNRTSDWTHYFEYEWGRQMDHLLDQDTLGDLEWQQHNVLTFFIFI